LSISERFNSEEKKGSQGPMLVISFVWAQVGARNFS
jgi:hypothetical protein